MSGSTGSLGRQHNPSTTARISVHRLLFRVFIELFHNLARQFIGIGRESLAWRLGSVKGKPYNSDGRQYVAGFYLHIERVHWSKTGRRNRLNTSWKRLCASCGSRSGTGGCSPMMSFNSGTRSTISSPFGSNASRSASRQRFNSASLLVRRDRMRL